MWGNAVSKICPIYSRFPSCPHISWSWISQQSPPNFPRSFLSECRPLLSRCRIKLAGGWGEGRPLILLGLWGGGAATEVARKHVLLGFYYLRQLKRVWIYQRDERWLARRGKLHKTLLLGGKRKTEREIKTVTVAKQFTQTAPKHKWWGTATDVAPLEERWWKIYPTSSWGRAPKIV